MEFNKSKLETIKSALMYAVMYAKTEQETAEFSIMLVDVEGKIAEEAETEARVKQYESLPGCVFKYCGYQPKCEGKCTHVKIDWEQGDLMEALSVHDSIYQMNGIDQNGNKYTGMGVYSCGELVKIEDIDKA